MTFSRTNYETNSYIEGLKKKRKKKATNSFVIDKVSLSFDKNAYIHRNPQNDMKWCLYYYDRNSDKRYRRTLIHPKTGHHPPNNNDEKSKAEALQLGMMLFVELKSKSDRGESITSINFGDLCKAFLRKEKTRISPVPHQGITKRRYQLITSQVKWARDFMNNDKIMVHRIPRTKFDSYEIWRKEQAREYGKQTPTQSTIVSELSTIGRMFKEVAVRRGFLTLATMPEIKWKRPNKRQIKRRDDFTAKEWEAIEFSSRQYFIKGRTRILDENYKMEKHTKGKDKGLWKTKTVVTRNSARGKSNLDHRVMFYWGMRIAIDSGIRIGSLKKLKWKHIDFNSALPESEKKTACCIDVPAENTKTGRVFRMTAPIVRHLNEIKAVNKFRRQNDYIFTNQYFKEPKQWSTRIWEDYLKEVLVEARLANWAEDSVRGKGNGLKIDIHSGKNLTFYSLRHSFITFALNRGVSVADVANQCDTSMKYIEDHYYHHRADESYERLMKGREKRIKPTHRSTDWINQVETEDFG